MKTFLYSLFLVVLFSSCTRKLAVIDMDQLKNSKKEVRSDTMDFELSMAHQTKKTIAFEVVISNTFNQSMEIDPLDFFYTPEDFAYSVNPYDPEYLRFRAKHPFRNFENQDRPIANGANVILDATFAADAIIVGDWVYLGLSGIRLFQSLAYAKDAKKILVEELLEKQTLKPGDRIRGLVYFPKEEFKKKESVYINWEREGEIVNRKFLVDRWRK